MDVFNFGAGLSHFALGNTVSMFNRIDNIGLYLEQLELILALELERCSDGGRSGAQVALQRSLPSAPPERSASLLTCSRHTDLWSTSSAVDSNIPTEPKTGVQVPHHVLRLP